MAKQQPPGAGGALSEEIERRQLSSLIATARQKLAANQKLAAREIAALKRFEREQLERYGPAYLAAMPKGDYARISGRQSKQLIEAADRYGLPYRTEDKTVDVARMLRWFHDFLAQNAAELAASAGDDPVLQLASGKLKDEYVREKILGVRLDNQRKETENAKAVDECLPVEPMRQLLNFVADRMRRTRERLSRKLDGEARDVADRAYVDMIDDVEKYISSRFNASDFENIDPAAAGAQGADSLAADSAS